MKFYGVRSRGKFWVHRVDDVNNVTHNGEVDEGRLMYNKGDDHLYTGSESRWVRITTPYDIFQVGTKLLFNSYPLPTNWNVDTTYDDRIVLTSALSGSVWTSGGSWMITGIQEDGSHRHGGRTSTPTANSSYLGASDLYAYGVRTNHTHSITAGGEHQHSFDGNWRPAHKHFLVGVYT